MAAKQRFFKTEIDRTPYGSCVLVAFLVISIFVLGCVLLWRGGGAMQRKFWPHWSQQVESGVSIPDPFQAAQTQLNQFKSDKTEQIQDAASNQLESAASAAASAAVDAAKDAAKDAVQQEAKTEAEQLLPGLTP